mmetsp:Transcript_30929/g.73482  ORF Transcript_30929/g.73482 Transcript_30929/m.73482 type:complete len:365 (-) Transcript_30929:155-1249(-)
MSVGEGERSEGRRDVCGLVFLVLGPQLVVSVVVLGSILVHLVLHLPRRRALRVLPLGRLLGHDVLDLLPPLLRDHDPLHLGHHHRPRDVLHLLLTVPTLETLLRVVVGLRSRLGGRAGCLCLLCAAMLLGVPLLHLRRQLLRRRKALRGRRVSLLRGRSISLLRRSVSLLLLLRRVPLRRRVALLGLRIPLHGRVERRCRVHRLQRGARVRRSCDHVPRHVRGRVLPVGRARQGGHVLRSRGGPEPQTDGAPRSAWDARAHDVETCTVEPGPVEGDQHVARRDHARGVGRAGLQDALDIDCHPARARVDPLSELDAHPPDLRAWRGLLWRRRLLLCRLHLLHVLVLHLNARHVHLLRRAVGNLH